MDSGKSTTKRNGHVAPKRSAAGPLGIGPTAKSARTTSGPSPAELAHMQDEVLAARLVEDLEFRYGVDVSTLDISVRDGRGIVRGIVSDADELEAVKETIQDEQGIADLVCTIQIAPSRREEDRDRARAIQEVLDSESDLGAQDIQVACVHHVAVLRGTVATSLHKVKAGLLALRQTSVQRVRNRLIVLEGSGSAGRSKR